MSDKEEDIPQPEMSGKEEDIPAGDRYPLNSRATDCPVGL